MAYSSMSLSMAFSESSDGITLKFPAKLWRIVNTCKTGSIGWMPDGHSIRIEKNKFEIEYLNSARFFKTTNFPSFIRQLNIYGFRKVPTASRPTRWLENSGNVFEYRHDCFLQGHPELLPEVRRNTAVRRTQRENALRDALLADTNKQLQDPQLVAKAEQLTHSANDTGEVTHPLLQTPSMMKKPPTASGAAPGVQPLPPRTSTITTVFMNPQTGMYDMQHISAARIQNQVVGVLPAIGDDDITSNYRTKPDKRTTQQVDTMKTHLPQNCGDASSSSRLKAIPNQILFLPKSSENMFLPTTDQLSQESMNSQHDKQVMFACPPDDDIEDDIHKTLTQCSLYSELEQDVKLSELNDSGTSDMTFDGDLDVFPQQLSIADSLSQFGEEQGYLTPAYFDPDTGLVTLLLPTLNPET